METILTVIYYIGMVLMAWTVGLELRRDLMMLQQNSYRAERYRRWLSQSGDTTATMRLCGMAVFLVTLVAWTGSNWGMGVMMLFACICSTSLLRARYKKPLVWTNRAKRIFSVEIILCVAVCAAAILAFGNDVQARVFVATVALTGLYCASHIITLAALWILGPVERHINRRYYNDAARRLASMPDLKIIGITGSYGKTSTKHYLHRILSEHFETLMTPGSFNTTLGVVRTVREHLKPYHEVFIVEMGAKNIGDIKEICDLVHPEAGIITAVGEQHLESFKTIENVQRTKFELADAIPSDGVVVLNNDFEYVANRPVTNTRSVRYAVKQYDHADWHAEDIQADSSGTTFTAVGPDGERLRLHTRLLGECNISNLLAAVIMARQLGVPDERIRYGVERIEPVEHRLSVKRTPGGVTILDDAFNSNPAGSAMALDVLAMMQGGRRIVVTPGMIELGDRQEEANREFGRHISRAADIALVVGQYNRDAICAGITESGQFDEASLHTPDTFAQAQQLLGTMLKPGDTVLYENDLPDTFK